MPRLFIAIDMSEEIRKHLAELQFGLREARWTKYEQLHLTLRFIGDISAEKQQDIESALGAVKAAPFDLRLNGLGRFPVRGEPRVLHAVIEDCPPLYELQKSIEDALEQAGIERDRRRFIPHVTLARFKRTPTYAKLGRYMKTHEHFVTSPMRVSEFVLYSSVLSPQGATHTPEVVYKLEG